MDEKRECVLKTLANECDYKNYKVFFEQDFLECFCCGEEKITVNGEELCAYLKEFEERGFIAVKYAFEGTYCVLALPALKEYFDKKEREKSLCFEREKWEKRLKKREFLFSFLGGFSGAAAACLFAAALKIFF